LTTNQVAATTPFNYSTTIEMIEWMRNHSDERVEKRSTCVGFLIKRDGRLLKPKMNNQHRKEGGGGIPGNSR
jgi:hypothetical protein